MNNNQKTTTFNRWMKNPNMQKEFDKEYEELLLSELVLAMMEENEKSVRKLAEEMGVSKTVIQNLRSGKQADVKLSNFINMAQACGYSIVLEKEDKRSPLAF